ncbi:hypothetical protein RB595_003695 [Gaeumannomyces hyphopodioides]
MTTPKEPPDDPLSPGEAPIIIDASPPAAAAAADDDDPKPSTPHHRRGLSAQPTPRSAPAGDGAGRGRTRQRSATMRSQPTLLTDFLLGRQSPARVAALRQQRMDSAAVRAEVRKEMRAASVQRLAPPGGVKDRVKAWQKNNATAMARGDPDDAATEPTDVAFPDGAESVTEEDRMRIKFRKSQKRNKSAPRAMPRAVTPGGLSKDDNDDENVDPEGLRSPPPKRIVSDDNWMKRRKRSPPGARAVRTKPPTGPIPIPKDFLQRTAQNPPVHSKIADWAARVEPMDMEPPKSPTSPKVTKAPKVKTYHTKSGDAITIEEDAVSGLTGSRLTDDEGLSAARSRRSKPADEDAESGRHSARSSGRAVDDDGIRVRPLRPKKPPRAEKAGLEDEGGSVRSSSRIPAKPAADDDGIRVRPLRPGRKSRPPSPGASSRGDDDGIRVRPNQSTKKSRAHSPTASSGREDDGARMRRSQSSGRARPVSPGASSQGDDDGIRARPSQSNKKNRNASPSASSQSEDDGIRARPSRSRRKHRDYSPEGNAPADDDGIRVRPSRSNRRHRAASPEVSDREDSKAASRPHYNVEGDVTEATSLPPTLPDDGIRVRPLRLTPKEEKRDSRSVSSRPSTERSRPAREPSRSPSEPARRRRDPSRPPRESGRPTRELSPPRRRSPPRRHSPPRGKHSGKRVSTRRDRSPSPSELTERTEETREDTDIPTRGPRRRTPPKAKRGKPAPTEITEATQTTQTTESTDVTESTEATGTSYLTGTTGNTGTTGTTESTRRTATTRPSRRTRTRAAAATTDVTGTTRTGDISDDRSYSEDSASEDGDSRRQPSLHTKSLADIPFGFSAFSELELPLNPKKPKQQRNPSFRTVPNVLKRVVNEGKKMIHHTVAPEPPKPATNQPPSIEKWLNNTVDPFVESPTLQKEVEHEWKKSARRRSVSERHDKVKDTHPHDEDSQITGTETVLDDVETRKEPEPRPHDEHDRTLHREDSHATSSSGLRRSGATRGSGAPARNATAKLAPKGSFREVLKEAFRGESGGHVIAPLMMYTSIDKSREPEVDEEDLDRDEYASRRRSTGSRRSRSPTSTARPESRDREREREAPPAASGLPRRKPPTNGFHELSTILSLEQPSSHDQDAVSVASHTTLTQTTALAKSSSSRRKNSGLKRRLTKHSDLVSVLSLPEDGPIPTRVPTRAASIRIARSLRRRSSKVETTTTVDDLLVEFIEDESFYQRELKTLVDGVIPVLLKEVVKGDSLIFIDLFGPAASDEARPTQAAEKAIVSMGVSLERIYNHHRAVPYTDIDMLLLWLERLVPLYSAYYDVWRLGFQDLIVNLASAADDENDSLVNAMPRNEYGDVINDDGDRVDVAHLLKRPLIRSKWLLKLTKGLRYMLGSEILGPDFTDRFADLQAKAQRRHREETARKTNDDAAYTDTTRTRDLRTLLPLDAVTTDKLREVSAKDQFSMDLAHSNGQRLECQVELIFRDRPLDPTDRGDLLIRENGAGGVSFLLFAPIPWEQVSARRGENNGTLVVMVRGTFRNDEWYEILSLQTEYDDAVREWLDMLGTVPKPPLPSDMSNNSSHSLIPIYNPSRPGEADVPVGEKARQQLSTSPGNQRSSKTPARYHARNRSVPTAPIIATGLAAAATVTPDKQRSTSAGYGSDGDRTPTQSMYEPSPDRGYSRRSSREGRPRRTSGRHSPGRDTPSPEPREDGAPPPPAHRTLTPKKPKPVELPPTSRPKRHGSSPLKHEYRPSDVSSSEEEVDEDHASYSESSFSDSESSGDDLEDEDVPDTEPGISIKRPDLDLNPTASVVSDFSITPSASASQANLRRGGDVANEVVKAAAVISYWSNKKGRWKELRPDSCSISITPGLLEVHPLSAQDSLDGMSDALRVPKHVDDDGEAPLIALDLTPLVMIRKSTAIDLEIRSPVRSYSKLNNIDGMIFRFRSLTPNHLEHLYMAVHQSRMNNAKFKALEEEARFRSFGQGQQSGGGNNNGYDNTSGHSSSRRRAWFGRRNSYRASTRAPSQSQHTYSQSGSSGISLSASSFLKRLTGSASAFNIDKSTLGKHHPRGDNRSRPVSTGPPASMYTTSSSSGRLIEGTPPRSPSASLASSPNRGIHTSGAALGTTGLRIRCHLLVSSNKWEDRGNCLLSISRPPPGCHQELSVYHGMEKRILVTQAPKRSFLPNLTGGGGGGDEGSSSSSSTPQGSKVILDVVLGSRCFSMLGSRGIILNVWEDLRDEQNRVGTAPAMGGLSGRVKKWCFQCASAAEANWIFGLVAREVEIP